MRKLSSTTGSDGYDEASWEIGNSSEASSRKVFYQNLIRKANTVPILRIFRSYGLRINDSNKNVVCPFKSHKGGRENSASFWYYPQTNSFYCFGCKAGGQYAHGCEFIAAMDEISRVKAAFKIIEQYPDDVDDDSILESSQNFSEQMAIMMEFSNAVRDFRQTHFDEKSEAFIENLCAVYDDLNLRHKLNNEALRRIVENLKLKIQSYKT